MRRRLGQEPRIAEDIALVPDHFDFDWGGGDADGGRPGWGKGGDLFGKLAALRLTIQAETAEARVEVGLKIAEKTGNYDPLVKAIERLDAVEEEIFSAEFEVPDGLLEGVRETVERGVTALNEANVFRAAPDFDGSHIDWLIGQNLEIYEDALGKGIVSEGGVDYFNLNAGAGNALIGENSEFTGNNNVRGTLQSVAANGGTMTIGMELVNFSADGPTFGLDIVAGWWDLYEAGEISNLVTFLTEQSADGVIQADTLLSFGAILDDYGDNAEAINVRPGYEFDADFNAHTPEEYIKLFKFVTTLLKDGDVGYGFDNVKMVWQSQSGAERSPNPIYDEANGAPAPITKQDIFDHMDLWYPGDEYVDIVGISLFQTAESAAGWMFADGEANNGLAVMDDFDLFLQAFADYAIDKGKTLDISEASPAGAYLDRDQFNELVQERLDELGPDYDGPLRFLEEGEVAYAKFHSDTDPDEFVPGGVFPEAFFDDSQPNYYVATSAQIWNDYFVPFFQFVERNAEVIDSINMISYNWDEVPLFESLITDADPNVPLQVNFGSGNWFDNPDIADLINGYLEDTFV